MHWRVMNCYRAWGGSSGGDDAERLACLLTPDCPDKSLHKALILRLTAQASLLTGERLGAAVLRNTVRHPSSPATGFPSSLKVQYPLSWRGRW